MPPTDGGPLNDPDDEFARLVLDEDFVNAAQFKEPPATDKVWDERRRRRAVVRQWQAPEARNRHRVRVIVSLLAVIAGVGAAGYWLTRPAHPTAGRGQSTPASTAGAPRSTPPPGPFAGSPAAGFATEAAGIAPPSARPIGRFTATQVAADFAVVRRMLIAAHLDPATLRGGTPAAFAATLDPLQRKDFLAGLRTSGPRNSRLYVTSFAPGGSELAVPTIKVRGTMSARQATERGLVVLRVHADYLFVYAVERPGEPSTTLRVIDRDVADVIFPAPGSMASFRTWLELWNAGGVANALCRTTDGYIHPAFRDAVPSSGATVPSGTPIDPYDQSRPPPAGAGCTRLSRT